MPVEQSDIDEVQEEGAPAWMVTFADLMTLLLVFFVLLFAMSEVKVDRFKVVMISIQNALAPGSADSILEGSKGLIPSEIAEIPPPVPEPLVETEPEPVLDRKQEILEDLRDVISRKQFGEFLVVYDEGKRIIIRIEGHALFQAGSVSMIDQVLPALNEILQLFVKYQDYNINIKGHTDNTPIRTARFPSNWELSAVRATTVLRYFLDRGISPSRMTATGYADRVPLEKNDTPEGRAMNRRVEFVLEKEE
jgi:chemotaxis protein MotB